MTQAEYLEKFKAECEAELALTTAKNADYANAGNAFANFELIEELSHSEITVLQGFIVRMSDKLQRIANLIARPNKVQDEKITDTLRDLSVYAKLMKIYLDEQ